MEPRRESAAYQNLTLGVVLPAVGDGGACAVALRRPGWCAPAAWPRRRPPRSLRLLDLPRLEARLAARSQQPGCFLLIALWYPRSRTSPAGARRSSATVPTLITRRWAVTVGQTVGAAGLAGAALLPVHRVGVRASWRKSAFATLFLLATIVAVGVVDARPAGGRGPRQPRPAQDSATASTLYVPRRAPLLGGRSGLRAPRRAALGRAARLDRDEAELAAVAHVCYVVFPASYGGWVQPVSIRVLFCLALLVGVLSNRPLLARPCRPHRGPRGAAADRPRPARRRSAGAARVHRPPLQRLASGTQALQPITAS